MLHYLKSERKMNKMLQIGVIMYLFLKNNGL